MEQTGKRKLKKIVGPLGGDKVVWIIAMMLILLSIVCTFSSTSRLLEEGQTRLDLVWKQMKVVAVGLVVIIICYNIRNTGLFRCLGRWGFLISLALLLFLLFGPRTGPVRSIELNGARRALSVLGKQVFIFEMIKVLMVLYLAWAVEAIRMKKGMVFTDMLASTPHLKWFGTVRGRKLVYVYFPFFITTFLIMPGSNSAAIFIAGIMFLTILLGGGSARDCAMLILIVIIGGGLCWGSYEITGHKFPKRFGLVVSRTKSPSIKEMETRYLNAKTYEERKPVLDSLRQPYSALIAVKEGGIIGKGPGQSTQRYVVPDISEDYMYSFIVEEYGLIGGIIIILLYASLLARASIIARNCGDKEIFAKTTVAGLSLLISLQAFLHICVNVKIGPMTGQTLPLISHGNSAFLCFCMAFGIIISISRIAQKRILEEQELEGSLLGENEDSTNR